MKNKNHSLLFEAIEILLIISVYRLLTFPLGLFLWQLQRSSKKQFNKDKLRYYDKLLIKWTEIAQSLGIENLNEFIQEITNLRNILEKKGTPQELINKIVAKFNSHTKNFWKKYLPETI